MNRQWSHFAVDFVTDLHATICYNSISVAVDRFLKMCQLIPFSAFSSPLQVVKALFQNIFCCFKILEDIPSDQGP